MDILVITLAVVAAGLLTGCFANYEDDCKLNMSLSCFDENAGGSSSGETTILQPNCIPASRGTPVEDDCGVFVSSSMAKEVKDGTKNAPFATIAQAIESQKTGPIYLCAESFPEAIWVDASRQIFGGLDCETDWGWVGDARKSEISPDADQVPLLLSPTIDLAVEDVLFRAKDAVEDGGSSIAIIAGMSSDLTLTRCDVEAGNAADGATSEPFATFGPAGTKGNTGVGACSAQANFGGLSVVNACDDADPNDDSIGGSGGIGAESGGGNGTSGQPAGAMNFGIGAASQQCTPGTAGDAGAAGSNGGGAHGMGSITVHGYAGTSGWPGDKGAPGQGGGGGGGAKGGALACTGFSGPGGAGGGSGGSGGCGGLGGAGGQAGGASIGILSHGAQLTFTRVQITTKAGGNGGNGQLGQYGGSGGFGGYGGSGGNGMLKDACGGGQGGQGGQGGRGGGGLGGHSIGIAFTGDPPDFPQDKITIGVAGAPGFGEGPDGTGNPGIAQKLQVFN